MAAINNTNNLFEGEIRENNIKNKELTYKEKRFVEEYIACAGNGTVAYCRAYNRNNDPTARTEAMKMLRKDYIQSEIQRQTKPYRLSLKQEEEIIRKRLMSMIDGTDKSASNSDVIRAADVINRMSARYLNRTTDETNKNNAINDLSTEEIMKIINENP